MTKQLLTIGQLAKQVGVSNDTIRMYEKDGLMDKPQRAENGYRVYPAVAIKRLTFIKRAKALGFTLKEIKELLAIQQTSSNTSIDMREQAKVKLDLIEQRIADLKDFKIALESLITACESHGAKGECPIIKFLEDHDKNN